MRCFERAAPRPHPRLLRGADPVLTARSSSGREQTFLLYVQTQRSCVLQSFKVPLNGTFIFLPAEGKVLLNSQAGELEFTQMEQLAQTAEQIPATNQFHTSKERKKGMAEAGQSKQALENSNPMAGIFSCYFSFHIQAFLEISRFSKAERAFAFI